MDDYGFSTDEEGRLYDDDGRDVTRTELAEKDWPESVKREAEVEEENRKYRASRSALQNWWDESDFTDKLMWLGIIVFVGAIVLSMMGVNLGSNSTPLDSSDNPQCLYDRSC